MSNCYHSVWKFTESDAIKALGFETNRDTAESAYDVDYWMEKGKFKLAIDCFGDMRLFFDGQEIELMINDIYDVKEAITFFEALTEGNKL